MTQTRELAAIAAHFDPDNKTLLARAVNRTMAAKLEALRAGNFERGWVDVIAIVTPADGDGIVVNAMFVPMECLRRIGSVLLEYADEIERLAKRFKEEIDR